MSVWTKISKGFINDLYQSNYFSGREKGLFRAATVQCQFKFTLISSRQIRTVVKNMLPKRKTKGSEVTESFN